MNGRRLAALALSVAATVALGCGNTSESSNGGAATGAGNSATTTDNSAATANSAAATTTAGNAAPGASAVGATDANAAGGAPVGTNGGATSNGVAASNAGAAASVDGSAKTGASSKPTAKMPEKRIGSGGNDLALFTKVRGAIYTDGELQSSNVIVNVSAGNITLTGTTASAEQRVKAEQIAEAVEGVKSVKNEIRVAAKAAAPR
jgi:hyperosmotically inducible protein